MKTMPISSYQRINLFSGIRIHQKAISSFSDIKLWAERKWSILYIENAEYYQGVLFMSESIAQKTANILAFIFTIIINALAGSTTLIGGKITAEISDANFTLITPAGYTFSIWGIIYVLLGIFVVYQAFPSQKDKGYHEKIGWLFVISSILNIVWLFLWQFEQLIFSVILMFTLLATLIAIYLRLDIGKSKVQLVDKLTVHLPFSTYLGWITIASIANVATWLVSINWDGFGINPETWASLIIIVALLLSLIVTVTRKDVAYALVIIWAFAGIASAQTANPNIVTLTQISAIIVFLALVATLVIDKLRQK
jgi:benzodiazapine receptor